MRFGSHEEPYDNRTFQLLLSEIRESVNEDSGDAVPDGQHCCCGLPAESTGESGGSPQVNGRVAADSARVACGTGQLNDRDFAENVPPGGECTGRTSPARAEPRTAQGRSHLRPGDHVLVGGTHYRLGPFVLISEDRNKADLYFESILELQRFLQSYDGLGPEVHDAFEFARDLKLNPHYDVTEWVGF